ncbi:hypothetical protein B1778_04290 [Dehalococcoides mccartyi]|uniref:HK97 family phage prohead protease n=1 Tax=Dehalococcoides mccartyi TaxID=61435 RepID=UPI0002B760A1|nr:HK97 family phage prohead protease [Dehalococcoides mccartyi]AGG07971.1 putative prohead protease [Dehalococcoides mccartyi BTF08]AQU05954.1 hypothetical protein B1777_04475 [Dehalococcoides mccartyi]AQU07399.1 hypothetical protein B1778_04290 [Dehalococcoides mccartyi]AQW62502.1 hypothetical protein B1779_04295 [Dehalococcoides mccartyi]
MEKKNFRFQMKEFDEQTGNFEGIASAYRKSPDKVKDIVEPGSFTKTIQENNNGVMLTFPPHDTDSPIGIGPITDSTDGIVVKGQILRGIQKGEEAYLLMKAGVIRTLSIGYEAIKWEIKNGIRHLQEIKLYEIGLVPGNFAADDMAVIHNVKAMTFAEALTNEELISKLWRIFSTMENVIMGIMRDEEETDKVNSLRQAVDEFSGTFNNWIDAMESNGAFKSALAILARKSGRILSARNKEAVQHATDVLLALLAETEDEAEPGKTTPPPDESKEAAQIDAIRAKLWGFDAKTADSRIDEITKRIGVQTHV